MTAAAATFEALLEMEGQMLGNRSSLGERQGPWLTYSLTQSLTAIHVSDTAATSQDGSIFRMQGAEGCDRVCLIYMRVLLVQNIYFIQRVREGYN